MATDAPTAGQKTWVCVHTFTAYGILQKDECVCAYLDVTEGDLALADRCTEDLAGPDGICCATLPTTTPEPTCTCTAKVAACREWEPRQVTDCAQANQLPEWR